MKRSTRSGRKDEDKKESEDWQKNTNASFGYGEITKVSKIGSDILRSCSIHIKLVKKLLEIQIKVNV